MGEIVNLHRARKDRARRAADEVAAANRAAFGRTRSEKDQQEALRAHEARKLDGCRLEGAPDNDRNA